MATSSDECERVEALLENGRESGAPDLELLGRAALREREPAVDHCIVAHDLADGWEGRIDLVRWLVR